MPLCRSVATFAATPMGTDPILFAVGSLKTAVAVNRTSLVARAHDCVDLLISALDSVPSVRDMTSVLLSCRFSEILVGSFFSSQVGICWVVPTPSPCEMRHISHDMACHQTPVRKPDDDNPPDGRAPRSQVVPGYE